jgi:hypothetical protein
MRLKKRGYLAEQIDLAYPLYLDVPMMTNFVAAIEDGIAYDTDVTQRSDQSKNISGEGEGRAGTPFLSLFSALISLDARGKIAGNKAWGGKARRYGWCASTPKPRSSCACARR